MMCVLGHMKVILTDRGNCLTMCYSRCRVIYNAVLPCRSFQKYSSGVLLSSNWKRTQLPKPHLQKSFVSDHCSVLYLRDRKTRTKDVLQQTLPCHQRHMHFCTATAPFDMSGFSDAPSLLDAISEQSRTKSVSAEEAAACLQTVHYLAYDSLKHLQWLHIHNGSLAYMQLLMNDKLTTAMGDILGSSGFRFLLERVESNLETLSTEDLTLTLLSLLWLGMEKHHITIRSMFLEMHDRVETMTLSQLLTMSDCLRALRRTDILLVGKVVQRFVELVKLKDIKQMSESEFSVIARLGTNVWNVQSNQATLKLAEITSDWLNQVENISDVNVLSTYCRLAKRLRTSQIEGIKIAKDKLEKLVKGCSDRLHPYHIAEIAHSLKTSNQYVQGISDSLQKRSLELIRSGELSKIGEIVNCCYALNRQISYADKLLVEGTLYRRMKDADVLVLSNIADILVDIDCKNQDIIHLFIKMVQKHMLHILNFVTRLSKILRFLNLNQCQRIGGYDDLYTAIFQQLHQQQGIHVWSISNLSAFLLRHVDTVIPDRLYERLMVAIPQCDLSEIQAIMTGLGKIRRPRIRMLQSQVQNLQSLIQQNISKQVDKINSLDMLHQMVVSLCLRFEVKDVNLLNALMDNYPKFTKNLSQGGFIKTLNILNQLMYYSPRILDDLSQYAVHNHVDLGLDRFSYFVKTLAYIGYVPVNVEAVSQICVQLFEESADVLDLPDRLSFVLDLCKLQIFPERILNSVFSVEFIEEVDKYINDHGESCHRVEETFMKLNRSMVLECPSLDIPWFHEQYCLDHISQGDPERNWRLTNFRANVESVLQEVLGGTKFYGTSCYTPHYYYLLDFECLLSSKGHVLPYTASSMDNSQQLGFQRVAISILTHSRYCRNEKRLIGSEQMKKRHLEIMGYKVVEVPIFEWKSMALSEHPARADYLRQKIFSH
ncbi:FAST kinase domain-containing protein 1, mitochondrial-like [Liolophura sinensis]|uniref:FAST kinase domain-containing protein 1, mitochondrial-like n=1 Tax=Liolophura sinensis TaxID=3198878 RepID=UPI003158DC06